jgi:hypothetical protein
LVTRRRGWGILFAAAAVLAGCSGDSDEEPSLAKGSLPALVLQIGDVGRPFVQFDGGPQTARDLRPATEADPTRFGRVGGWKARFRRPGTPATEGPLVIESKADVFEDDDGAEGDLDSHEEELAELEPVDAPAVGEETVALTSRQGELRFFTIAWRYRNATASVTVNGFDGQVTLDHVRELAVKQQRRLERAAR